MAMEIFLMADVPELGVEGDVVSVANGYARNYLLPNNLAAPVTDATKRQLAKIQRERDAQRKATLEAAQARAARIANASCTIPVKTDGGKLYGSVTAADIESALKSQGTDLDRGMLVIEAPIKELGVYDITVNLHQDVTTTIKVWVVEE